MLLQNQLQNNTEMLSNLDIREMINGLFNVEVNKIKDAKTTPLDVHL